MEFFLDIDGVILDFEKGFVDFIRKGYLPDLPSDFRPTSWSMEGEFGQLDIEKVWAEFLLSETFRRLDLLVDANRFNELSAQHPVHLITNLPWDQYKKREENLLFHDLKFSSLQLGGHWNFGDESYPSKSQVISNLHTPGKRLIFLDDHPKNCEDIKSQFSDSEVFLMTRPHNEKIDASNWTRVNDWSEFLELAC